MKYLKIVQILQESEKETIDDLTKGVSIQLHLYSKDLKELCIKYENTPYLQQLPTVIPFDRSKVHPAFKENYLLSIALKSETHEINLHERKGADYPITLFYIHSPIEKFDTNYLFIILRFNCSYTELNPQWGKLLLKVLLASVDGIQYKGHISVKFIVIIYFSNVNNI